MGYFNLFKSDKNNEYYFNLKAVNHEIILQSEGYTTKAGAENGIDSVKTNSQFDSKYDRLTAKNDQFYFNLKASNGQIIGTSQMYTSKAGMENGIASVKTNAPSAEIQE
jgi:uncharacterized protein YegP (UPF0339 family)